MEQQTEENCPESYFCPISQELMEDPVMDPEGNTYERRNIETWLQQNATSPITRSPLRITDLVPNRALREAIEAHKKAGKSTAKPAVPRKVIPGAAPELPPVVVNAVARRDTEKEDEYEVLLSIQPPEGTIRTPANICCVVDVSGSMGSEATLKNASGQTESHGLSLLDIVKHAVRTIVATLNANDQLAIVTYSSKAETVFRLRPMDKRAKDEVNKVLDHLEADGSTNLWDGLHTGLELLRQEEQTTSGRYNSLLLLTDGLPNISPPRGEVGMLQRYNDQYPNVACTISTFGFGYDINSDLLKNLAVTGRGMYAFIPDSSFVGTAFVHAASNALTTMARDVSLSLEPINGSKIVDGSVRGDHIVNVTSWGLSVNLCSLQYGQSKDLVVRVVIPNAEPTPFLNVTVDYIKLNDGQPEKVTIEATERDDSNVEVEVQRFRLAFVDTLKRAMTLFRQNKQEEAKEGIEKLVGWIQDLSSAGATKDPRVVALLEDLTGQVTEALSKEEYYKKWGQHYLPSLMRAHQLQQCNNFKDPGIQHYGGKLFSALRDEVDDIFCKLPPPKPTYPINSHGGFVHVAPPMSVYHSNSNPCFAGESVVMMADGTRKRVADIVKGDRVAVSLTCGGAAEVVCVVKTHCGEGRAQLVELEGGLQVTPYHPVRIEGGEGRWYFPCMLGEVRERECPAVYSFVLKEECGGVMVINGVECVALGHGLQDDEGVVGHPYFGTSWVIEDLRRMVGWAEGLVELGSGCMVRDTKTGLVCGLRQQPRAQQQQATLCGAEVDIVASSGCCEEGGECVA